MRAKISFEIGETVWKQRMELIKETDGTYTIIKHAVNQRDETDTIRGITADVIRNMLQAIQKKLV
jgi:hypothetical protein